MTDSSTLLRWVNEIESAIEGGPQYHSEVDRTLQEMRQAVHLLRS